MWDVLTEEWSAMNRGLRAPGNKQDIEVCLGRQRDVASENESSRKMKRTVELLVRIPLLGLALLQILALAFAFHVGELRGTITKSQERCTVLYGHVVVPAMERERGGGGGGGKLHNERKKGNKKLTFLTE